MTKEGAKRQVYNILIVDFLKWITFWDLQKRKKMDKSIRIEGAVFLYKSCFFLFSFSYELLVFLMLNPLGFDQWEIQECGT